MANKKAEVVRIYLPPDSNTLLSTFDHCIKAIRSGYYQSVMIDASNETFNENKRITKEVVNEAHSRGIAVEAELGVLSGIEGHLDVDKTKALYTDPEEVVDFVFTNAFNKIDC